MSAKVVDQEKLRKRIMALTPRFHVNHPTRFKYLLANAVTQHTLTARLWRIYEKHPEYYLQLTRYLQRYGEMPRGVAERVYNEIVCARLYPAVTSAFIDAAHDRVPIGMQAKFNSLLSSMWQPSKIAPELAVSVGRWLFKHEHFIDGKADYACRKVHHWWVRAKLILAFDTGRLITATHAEYTFNGALRDHIGIVSAASAIRLSARALSIRPPKRTIHRHGGLVLKNLGILTRGTSTVCGIVVSIDRMSATSSHPAWRKFFGKHYRKAER